MNPSIYYEPPLTSVFASAIRAVHSADAALQELSTDLAQTLNLHLFNSGLSGETVLYLRNATLVYAAAQLNRNPQLQMGVFSEDGSVPRLYQMINGQLEEVWNGTEGSRSAQTAGK